MTCLKFIIPLFIFSSVAHADECTKRVEAEASAYETVIAIASTGVAEAKQRLSRLRELQTRMPDCEVAQHIIVGHADHASEKAYQSFSNNH